MPLDKPNILVLCTGNSCRSQMTEGFLRHLAGDRFHVFSAGSVPKEQIHPLAVRVMQEAGVSLDGQRPKDVKEFLGRLAVRHLIVVCSSADRECPRIFPNILDRIYWPIDDPDAFRGSEAATLAEFRRVRDDIRSRVEKWLAEQP